MEYRARQEPRGIRLATAPPPWLSLALRRRNLPPTFPQNLPRTFQVQPSGTRRTTASVHTSPPPTTSFSPHSPSLVQAPHVGTCHLSLSLSPSRGILHPSAFCAAGHLPQRGQIQPRFALEHVERQEHEGRSPRSIAPPPRLSLSLSLPHCPSSTLSRPHHLVASSALRFCAAENLQLDAVL